MLLPLLATEHIKYTNHSLSKCSCSGTTIRASFKAHGVRAQNEWTAPVGWFVYAECLTLCKLQRTTGSQCDPSTIPSLPVSHIHTPHRLPCTQTHTGTHMQTQPGAESQEGVFFREWGRAKLRGLYGGIERKLSFQNIIIMFTYSVHPNVGAQQEAQPEPFILGVVEIPAGNLKRMCVGEERTKN